MREERLEYRYRSLQYSVCSLRKREARPGDRESVYRVCFLLETAVYSCNKS